MNKLLFLLPALLIAPHAFARNFTYEYEGQTITYTVLNEDDKTCYTAGNWYTGAGSKVSGDLILPSNPKDGDVEFTLTKIGGYSFRYCSNMTSIVIPNSVTSIDLYAFNGCSGLTSLEIPTSVTSIGVYAFYGCTGLTSIDIPNTVTSIGGGTFSHCTGLTSIELPDSIFSIGRETFFNCTGLTSIKIPDAVTSIGSLAFRDCPSLTSLVIPNSVISIDGEAFRDCIGLKWVIIGRSVTVCHRDAFYGCKNIIKAAYPNTIANPFPSGTAAVYSPTGAFVEDGFVYGPDKSAIYYVPYTVEGEFVVPESVTTIGAYAFSRCKGLTSMKFPGALTSVGYGAFVECWFDKVEFESVESLCQINFANLDANPLRFTQQRYIAGESKNYIDIPNTIKYIGSNVFNSCWFNYEAAIPPSVETIGENAFANNPRLKYVYMGCNLKTIRATAFDGSPVEKVYITAQIPPQAPRKTFSTKPDILYLQDPGDNSVIDAYSGARACWDWFSAYESMTVAKSLNIGRKEVTGTAGTTVELVSELSGGDIPFVYWRSTNPDVATVRTDTNLGEEQTVYINLVDADADGATSCSIIGETFYYDGPTCEVTVRIDQAGIDDVVCDSRTGNDEIDYTAPYDIYNLGGAKVASGTLDGLRQGVYIIRQGNVAKKITLI